MRRYAVGVTPVSWWKLAPSCLALLKPGRAAWLQALGRKIAPPATGGGGACGGCDSCGPTPPKQH